MTTVPTIRIFSGLVVIVTILRLLCWFNVFGTMFWNDFLHRIIGTNTFADVLDICLLLLVVLSTFWAFVMQYKNERVSAYLLLSISMAAFLVYNKILCNLFPNPITSANYVGEYRLHHVNAVLLLVIAFAALLVIFRTKVFFQKEPRALR